MLKLAYLGEAKKLNLPSNTLRFLIVRKPVSGIPVGFIHVPQLSPSLPLFEQTQVWKKGMFTESEKIRLTELGVSTEDPFAYWTLYEESFNQEMVNRPDMVRALQRLGERLNNGEEIYAFCYCKDVCRCHRGLIGRFMEENGFQVDYRKSAVKEKEKVVLNQLSLFD